MSRGKRVIGIVLIIVSIAALVSWEKWGKKNFLYEEIAVFAEDVPRGTLITADMIKSVSWPKEDADAIKRETGDAIYGKIANQYIKKNNPIYTEYFTESQITPSGVSDKYILTICKDWIESCPKTIDKMDRIYMYVNGQMTICLTVISQIDEDGNFNVIASKTQIELLSKLVYGGNKFIISYDKGA